MKTIKDKVVAITGAVSGMGLQLAIQFAQETNIDDIEWILGINM
ncbi:hypothetical protein [Halioglobus maricola]|nr:hypothetical protein [Halioglobus maricola]